MSILFRFNPQKCGFQCPAGLMLAPCGSSTFEDPDATSQCPRACIGLASGVECLLSDNSHNNALDLVTRRRRWDECVPQCVCPDGLFMDSSNSSGVPCVPQSQCSCYSQELGGRSCFQLVLCCKLKYNIYSESFVMLFVFLQKPGQVYMKRNTARPQMYCKNIVFHITKQ